MYVVYYGNDFDADGRNIPMLHKFATLDEARAYTEKIYTETMEIVGIFQE